MDMRVFLCAVAVCALASSTARAEDPPCDYQLQSEMVSRMNVDDCVDISISSCFIALEGSVTNNCAEAIELGNWPGLGASTMVAAGSSQYFAALESIPNADGGDTESYSGMGSVTLGGMVGTVEITATIFRFDNSSFGGCTSAPEGAPASPWVLCVLGMLVLGWRRRA